MQQTNTSRAFNASNVFLERDASYAKDRWHHNIIRYHNVIRRQSDIRHQNVIPAKITTSFPRTGGGIQSNRGLRYQME